MVLKGRKNGYLTICQPIMLSSHPVRSEKTTGVKGYHAEPS